MKLSTVFLTTLAHTSLAGKNQESKSMIPPGLEPGTFRVLGERDNHYTTESGIEEHFYSLNSNL